MEINQVRSLYYNQELTAQEIGDQLGKTVWQVIRFMKKSGIARRDRTRSRSLKFARSPLSFSKSSHLTREEFNLYLSGLMLYWAEGSNKGKSTVDFANSSLEMCQIFLKMLREIYHVNDSRLRIFIYQYSNQLSGHLIHAWSEKLKIPEKQFTKPYVKIHFDPTKTDSMPLGLVHIRYSDTRLLTQIKQDIGIISSQLISRDGGAVKHTSL